MRNSSREMTMEYLRITDQEYDRFFREAEDQLYFTYLLQIMGIPARCEKLKIERRLQVNLLVARLGMPLDNFIYYAHNNTGVFNWLSNSLRKPVTQEQFNDFHRRVDYNKLPFGIKFELKTSDV